MSALSIQQRVQLADIRLRTNAALAALHEQNVPEEARVAFLQSQLYTVLDTARRLTRGDEGTGA